MERPGFEDAVAADCDEELAGARRFHRNPRDVADTVGAAIRRDFQPVGRIGALAGAAPAGEEGDAGRGARLRILRREAVAAPFGDGEVERDGLGGLGVDRPELDRHVAVGRLVRPGLAHALIPLIADDLADELVVDGFAVDRLAVRVERDDLEFGRAAFLDAIGEFGPDADEERRASRPAP